jgi:hypothetical protein
MVEPGPLARAEGLVVRELGGEVLVYDLGTHTALCLNAAAAAVWRLCDGRRTAADIARALAAAAGGDVSEEFVWLALERLGREGLLAARVRRPSPLACVSRREMMRRVGLAAALALPAVVAIVAPTPAQAASLLGSGAGCSDGAQCQSGICNGGQCV